jgi:hypothetical protein
MHSSVICSDSSFLGFHDRSSPAPASNSQRRGETTIKLEGNIAAILAFARLRSGDQVSNARERWPNRSVILVVPRV